MNSYHLDHLQHLETEAIHIMREVGGEFERPALLFSGGKDSICLLRLAEKAFRPSELPMPLLNVDTGPPFSRAQRDSATAARSSSAPSSSSARSTRPSPRASRSPRRRDQSQPAPDSHAARRDRRVPLRLLHRRRLGATRRRPAPRSASSVSATASANGTRRTSAPKSGTSTTAG